MIFTVTTHNYPYTRIPTKKFRLEPSSWLVLNKGQPRALLSDGKLKSQFQELDAALH